MPSTYTTSGIELIGAGEQTGTWGDTTNDNLQILDRLVSQAGTISLSGTTHTLTISDGILSDGQYAVLVFGGSPSGTNTVTISPNDAKRLWFVKNSSGQSVILTQGSGGNVTVANGKTAVVYCDGGGSGAAVVELTGALSGVLLTSDIDTTVQGYDAGLADIAGLAVTNGNFIVGDGANWVVESGDTAIASLGVTATAAELNTLDGVTATTAELNILDGVTATATEINLLDGVTGTLVTEADTQTLTNKTLTSPTLTSPAINVTSDATGDLYYRTAGGAFQRLGIGSTDQVLTVASGLPSWEDAAGWTQTAFSATTSGTAVDFTSIPSGVNEIDVIVDGVSFSGSNNILVQLGTGGSPESSGYVSNSSMIGNTANNNFSSSGFITRVSFASNTADGIFRLFRLDGNQWFNYSFVEYQSSGAQIGIGQKSLAGELDMIRVTRDGSDTFDAGQVAIRYK